MPVQHMRSPEQAQCASSPDKNHVTSKSPVGDISVVTLIRTDTTLDHSQKAEKVWCGQPGGAFWDRHCKTSARQDNISGRRRLSEHLCCDNVCLRARFGRAHQLIRHRHDHGCCCIARTLAGRPWLYEFGCKTLAVNPWLRDL